MRCFIFVAGFVMALQLWGSTPSVGQLQIQELYPIPEGASFVVMDSRRSRLYFGNSETRSVHVLDLASGIQISSVPLSLFPRNMALTPDGNWLYVAEHPDITGPSMGLPCKIAEIGLASQPISVREIDYPFSPMGIQATDSRLLIVSNPSAETMQPELRVFDPVTGVVSPPRVVTTYEFTLDPSQESVLAYGLGNRFAANGRGFFSSAQEGFSSVRPSPCVGGDFSCMIGLAFASLDGSLIINGNKAYRGAANDPSKDLRYIQVITNIIEGPNVTRFDKPPRPVSVSAGFGGFYFSRTDILRMFHHVALAQDQTALDVGFVGDQVYGLVQDQFSSRRIVRFFNPSIGIETNMAPMARFSAPAKPKTTDSLLLDASASTDDLDAGGELFYRWDFDADGIFDTEFSHQTTASWRFRASGTNTVRLEVRDRFGLSSMIEQSFFVNPVTDGGEIPMEQTPWQFAFAASELAFDPIRPFLYATDQAGKLLIKLNLTNGIVERRWKLDEPPGPLAVSPNGSRVFVAMSTNDPITWGGRRSGWIAEFDPVTNLRLREFPIFGYAYDLLATEAGWVVVHGETNAVREIQVYDAASGRKISQADLEQPSQLALHPSESVIYAGALESNPSILRRYILDPATGIIRFSRQSAISADSNVFIVPDPLNLFTGSGTILTASTNAAEDLRLVHPAVASPLLAVASVPSRGLIGFLSPGQLDFLVPGSWTNFVTFAVPNETRTFAIYGEEILLVSTSTEATVVSSRLVPATRVEENRPPAAHLLSLTNGQINVFGEPVALAATAEDVDGVITSVRFFANETLIAELFQPPYVTNWIPSAPGTYRIAATAIDNLGVSSSSAATLIVNAAPVVSLSDPVGEGQAPLLSPATLQLVASASDPDGRIVRVEFFHTPENGSSPVLLGITATPPYSLTLSNFVGSGGSISAVAFDDLGTTNIATVQLRMWGLLGDDSRRPIILQGNSVQSRRSTITATTQASDPMVFFQNRLPGTLWWSWTAPSNGIVRVDTIGSSLDTYLMVLSDRYLHPPDGLVGYNDDDPIAAPASLLNFPVIQGTNYTFVVSGATPEEQGEVALNLHWRPVTTYPLAEPPSNDLFENRTILFGTNIVVEGSNRGATREFPESSFPRKLPFASVWWEWTAPQDGMAVIDMLESNFQALIGAFQSPANPRPIGFLNANYDGYGQTNFLGTKFSVGKGRRYFIAVDGLGGDQGDFKFNLRIEPSSPPNTPPANDHFADRIMLTGERVTASGRSNRSTLEPGEDRLFEEGYGTGSVWWSWVAPSNLTVDFQVRSFSFRTGVAPWSQNSRMMIYQGTHLSNLTLVAVSRPVLKPNVHRVSVLRLSAEAGQTYHIAVGSAEFGGDIFLTINPVFDPSPLTLDVSPSSSGAGQSVLEIDPGYARAITIESSSDLARWTPYMFLPASELKRINVTLTNAPPNQLFFRLSSFE